MLKQIEALAHDGQPGETVVYYRGFLWIDREGNPKLSDIAETALELAAAGQVLLFQRKLGENDCEYIARRSTTPALKFTEHCAGRTGQAVSGEGGAR